jgi:type IV secretion system protein VirB10
MTPPHGDPGADSPRPPRSEQAPRADETSAPDSDERLDGSVPGERGIPSINRTRSVQSRVSAVLTVGLLGLLAAGLLYWYYAGGMSGARARELAAAAARRRAQADSSLPSLGLIKQPAPSADPSLLDRLLPPPAPLPETAPPLAAAARAYRAAGPRKKSRAELDFERRLAGPVLAVRSNGRSANDSGAQSDEAPPETTTTAEGVSENPPRPAPAGNAFVGEASGGAVAEGTGASLGELLKSTPIPAVVAQVLPTRRLLLPKGAFIDCTLETAISSALPGMTTCITATDTFGADGMVVLIERGSKLVGETRGQVQAGQARLFVLWTEARTPAGIVVPLASPGTDELGRSGLSGSIDYHWWQRFGTAILITIIDGAVEGLTQSQNANGTVVVNPSAANGVATEVLRDTLRIRPTIEKPQGDRIQILVARDVDFRSVYALHPAAGLPPANALRPAEGMSPAVRLPAADATADDFQPSVAVHQ